MDLGRPTRELFERLLVLRWAYAFSSDYDRRAVLSVAAAVDYAEWRMRMARMAERRRRSWQIPHAA